LLLNNFVQDSLAMMSNSSQ